jgi:hypothetical protein
MPKETFDPADIVEQLRDKIRLEAAKLMTEEQWKSLLESELRTFFRDHHDGYRDREAKYKGIVRDVMAEAARDRIREAMESPAWASEWSETEGEGGLQPTKVIRDFLRDHMQSLLNAALQNVVGGVLRQMSEHIRNNPGGYR